MPTAFISSLKRDLRETEDQPQPFDLRGRFIDWYAALPEIGRHRAFAMVELESALQTQGRHLSPIMLSLGWQRKRKWASRQQYLRYWLPPGM